MRLGIECGLRFRFGELLTELEIAGFLIFGAREVQVMKGGLGAGVASTNAGKIAPDSVGPCSRT